MELYGSKTKKELIDIIKQLEKQVSQLSSKVTFECSKNSSRKKEKDVHSNTDILRSVRHERILASEEILEETPSFSYDNMYPNFTFDDQVTEIEELRSIFWSKNCR